MRFVTFDEVVEKLNGKTIAIVGSGPGCVENEPGFIDSHDLVVRVNNYKLGKGQGFRTDVHHSFYGGSIRKDSFELKKDGVQLCMCKCPNDKPIESDWHEENGKVIGIDFKYIYKNRSSWWFCDTFIPNSEHFLESFNLLERHIPTSGFAAIYDVLKCNPKSVYLTGFDFFSSGIHNVDEKWKKGDTRDPICHRPDLEMEWVFKNSHRMSFDKKLTEMIKGQKC